MDTNFLDSVMQTAQASSALEQQAKEQGSAKAQALENKGADLQDISGGLLVGGGIVGKATGLSDEAVESLQNIMRNPSGFAQEMQSSAQAVGQRVSSAVNTISDHLNPSTPPSAQDAIMDADPEAGVSGLEATTSSDVGAGIGEALAGDAVADGVAGVLGATGIGAPLAGVVLLGSVLGTAIEGIGDLISGHHSTPPAPDLSGIVQPMFTELQP